MLSDVQKVDLRLSTWDEATSEPHKGRYNWTKKVLVNYHTPDRPPFFFKWQKDSVYYMSKERAEMGYEPVVAPTKPEQKHPEKDGFDPYFPEGAEITSDGRYRYGDVIWCRCPLINELKRMERNDKISKGAAESRLDQFSDKVNRDARDAGEDKLVSISKEELDRMRGNL